MFTEGGKNHAAGWGVLLLPTMTVVLFYLLRMKLQTPTAGGLAFLASAMVAYFCFPRLRLRLSRLVPALALAALAAALLGKAIG